MVTIDIGNNKKGVKFKHLKQGDTFLAEKRLFMKLLSPMKFVGGENRYNAIDMETGTVAYFYDYESVEPINVTIQG